MSIDKVAQYFLKLEECDFDHNTVRLGSGAGPKLRRVWRNLYVVLAIHLKYGVLESTLRTAK